MTWERQIWEGKNVEKEFVWRSNTSKFNIDKSLGKENHESGEREMS